MCGVNEDCIVFDSVSHVWIHPTCVREIEQYYISDLGEPVHPHVCGVNVFQIVRKFINNFFGSSPRMWGKYSFSSIFTHPLSGSSPRMWGK